MEAITACLIILIFSVKEANSLQALVDGGSGATDTGGFVSLLTVSNKAHALLFLAMMSERKDHLAFLSSKLEMQGISL